MYIKNKMSLYSKCLSIIGQEVKYIINTQYDMYHAQEHIFQGKCYEGTAIRILGKLR